MNIKSVLKACGFIRKGKRTDASRGGVQLWHHSKFTWTVWERRISNGSEGLTFFQIHDHETNQTVDIQSDTHLCDYIDGIRTLKGVTIPLINSSARDKTIREMQTSLPWTAHYHRDFRNSPMAHKDFAHALVHVHKAGGRLAAIIDEAEHAGHNFEHEDVQKYVADLVICALRMANTCPGGVIDLQQAVERRIRNKNSDLAEKAPALAAKERSAI